MVFHLITNITNIIYNGLDFFTFTASVLLVSSYLPPLAARECLPACWSYLLGANPSHQRLLQSLWKVPTSPCWSYLLGANPSHLHLLLQSCWRVLPTTYLPTCLLWYSRECQPVRAGPTC